MSLFDLQSYEWAVYAVVSALLTGLIPNFLKIGTRRIAPSFSAFIYSFLYTCFLALACFINKEAGLFSCLNSGSFVQLICLGTISAFAYLCYTTALLYGGVTKVVPVLLFRTIFSVVIDLYTNARTPSKIQICALILMTLGTLLLESGRTRNSRKIWILFALLSLVLFTLYDLLYERVWKEAFRSENSCDFIVSMISVVILFLICIVGRAVEKPGKMSPSNWIFLLVAGSVSGLSVVCSKRADLIGDIRYLKPIESLWFPVSMLCARIIHKEELPVGALFGILMIIIGSFGLMLV